MKFAVVEYNSKSGGIWKHTPENPNFLADPKTEIDPTSFGCYVSALEGEHIPLLGLIKPGFIQKVAKRLTGNWLSAYSIEYLLQFDVLMVVHQLSDAHEMLNLLQRIKKMPSPPFIIGVPTQPYGILSAELDKDDTAMKTFRDFMDSCDVFLSVVKSTVDWYAQRTKTPVVYMPQPYPAAYAGKQFIPLDQKKKQILVAGVTERNNISQGQKIASQIQRQFTEYEIVVPKVAELDYDFSNLSDSRYRVLPFEAWQDHLQTLAETMLVVNTDYTKTRGRVQTDCAAVGTPSLGGDSDGQVDLFPDLSSNPDTPIEEIIKNGTRLLTEKDWYQSIVHDAQEKLQKYDYEESAARIHALVRNYTSQ